MFRLYVKTIQFLIAASVLTPILGAADDHAPATSEVVTPLPAEPAKPNDAVRVYWKSGLRLEGLDGDIKLKLGARILNDWAWFVENNGIDSQDGTSFRAARLELEGALYEHTQFKFQYDFASSSPFKDVFLGYGSLPVLGSLRIGHFKEPFSLSELTSSKQIAMMERGLPNALVPGRNTGIALQNAVAEDRATYALGMFRDSDGLGKGVGDKNYALTGRLTGLLHHDGDNLVHLGAAASYRKVDDIVSYSVKPESNLAASYLKSGDLAVDDTLLYGGELAAVFGSAHLAAEYIGAYHRGVTDYALAGLYAEIGYFWTGEARTYGKKDGAFKGVKPKQNFLKDGGAGAWESVIRVSHLDFDDNTLGQGALLDVTVGLTWYLNPHARIMLNYVVAKLDGVDPGHIVQSRFQVDF